MQAHGNAVGVAKTFGNTSGLMRSIVGKDVESEQRARGGNNKRSAECLRRAKTYQNTPSNFCVD